jgi:hypothetical protein
MGTILLPFGRNWQLIYLYKLECISLAGLSCLFCLSGFWTEAQNKESQK